MTQEMIAMADISNKITRIEVMQDASTKAISDMAASVNRLVDKLDKSDDIAREALQSTRSAHHRLDELKSEVNAHRILTQTRFKDQEESTRWRIGLSLTIGGLVITAVTFAINYYVGG